MDKKLLVFKILRILFAIMILVWGIIMWKAFPEQIPLHFDVSLKPDEIGEKKKFVWLFLYAIAAIVPIPAERMEDENAQKIENKKAAIMSWIHTAFMSAIFVIMFTLIAKNL